MIGYLRQLLGRKGDPTDYLKQKLAEGTEGVDWIATPLPKDPDPSELTPEERARGIFESRDAALNYAGVWGPAGFAKGGPIPQSDTLTLRAYDPETATLTVATPDGHEQTVTAYWVATLRPHRGFTDRQEIVWSNFLTPSRGKGIRPTLMARVHGHQARHPSLPSDYKMGDLKAAMPFCYAAGSFVGLDDVLALTESEGVSRLFVTDAADLPGGPS